jgi:hypothetical protein
MTEPNDEKIFDFNVKQYEEHRQLVTRKAQ